MSAEVPTPMLSSCAAATYLPGELLFYDHELSALSLDLLSVRC